jgi:glycosyltransferase involved in cell wall biosynthesis
MRIAYCAGFQGPELIRQRTIQRNRALAGTQKILYVVRLLEAKGHEVAVFSNGVPAERSLHVYPAFYESIGASSRVYYPVCLDAPAANILTAYFSLLPLFVKHHRRNKFDCMIIYNMGLVEIRCALYASTILKLPVLLEYEDNACFHADGHATLIDRYRRYWVNRLAPRLNGCFAASNSLFEGIPTDNRYLLRGILDNDLITQHRNGKAKKEKIMLFTGSLMSLKNIENLIEAWKSLQPLQWQLHITGTGQLDNYVRQASASLPSIVFHGLVDRKKLNELLCKAAICVNPNCISTSVGNIFPFKIVEYLAGGGHVLSTTIEDVGPELAKGITMIDSDDVSSLAQGMLGCINRVPNLPEASAAAQAAYNQATVADNLEKLLRAAVGR